MKSVNVPSKKILAVAKRYLSICRENVYDMKFYGITKKFLIEFDENIKDVELFLKSFKEKNSPSLNKTDIEILLTECHCWCKTLTVRTKLTFQKNTSLIYNFPNELLKSCTDSESNMKCLLETLLDIAENFHTELAENGQTIEFVQKGRDLLRALRKFNAEKKLRDINNPDNDINNSEKLDILCEKVNKIIKIGKYLYANEPEKLLLFGTQLRRLNSGGKKVFEGQIDPESTITVAKDIKSDSPITIQNIGNTILTFYVSENGKLPVGTSLVPGENIKTELLLLGDGNLLKVCNKNSDEIGSYKIDLFDSSYLSS